MAVDRKAVFSGGALILFGLVLLAANFSNYGMEELWPMFIIAGGLMFAFGFVSDRRNYGLLMPATILLLYGLLFQFCALTNWDRMEQLWPTFILGPGLGLLAMYLWGKREAGLLIPASILIGMATIFFFAFGPFQEYARYWPVLLILAGIAMLLRRRDHLPQSSRNS